MKDKIRIGFVGCGQFARNFVPLFQAHPAVEYVAVCDKFRERSEEYDKMFHVDRIFDTYEEMLASDRINAIAIFSQRNQHGQMAIAALNAGKHVYSAVPMAMDIEEIKEIVRLVEKTGLVYSMGETGIYRPASVFCRTRNANGEFGDFVYGEAQYNHDMNGLYNVYKYTEGENWKKMAGMPPMTYPTHSTSMVLSATNAYALKVAAFGYEDKIDPDIFGRENQNYWHNPYSNTSMLLKLSNGGVARISENRRIAWGIPETYISNFCGTKASYECSINRHSVIKGFLDKAEYEDVSDIINPIEMTLHKDEPDFVKNAARGAWSGDNAPIQNTSRLPKEFDGLKNGHAGTHKFMVDDFCQSYWSGMLSPTNAWQAARYNIPGLTALISVMQGGVTLDVPDCGNPPEKYQVLSADRIENPVKYDTEE